MTDSMSTSLQITLFRFFLWLRNIPLYICATSSLAVHVFVFLFLPPIYMSLGHITTLFLSLPQKHLILIFPLLLAPTLKTATSPSIHPILQCQLYLPKVQVWLFTHLCKSPHFMEEKIQTTHIGIPDLSSLLCGP